MIEISKDLGFIKLINMTMSSVTAAHHSVPYKLTILAAFVSMLCLLGIGVHSSTVFCTFLVTDGLSLYVFFLSSLCWLSVSIAPPPPPMPQLTPQIPLTGFVARMQESSK